MPRKKCYGSKAEKQRAYRLRKAGLVLVKKEVLVDNRSHGTREDLSGAGAEPIIGASESNAIPEGRTVGSNPATGVSLNNLPVPVLAEPQPGAAGEPVITASGEARESTPSSTNDNKLAPLATKAAPPNADSDSRGGQALSYTDQKFEEDRPGWYIFGKLEKEKNCWKCGKKFSTRLEMNKFCSPRCKNEYLDTAFTKLRNQ